MGGIRRSGATNLVCRSVPVTNTATTAQPYGDPNQFQPIQGTSWLTGGVNSNTAVSAANASEFRDRITFSRDTFGAVNADERNEYVVVQASARLEKPVSTAGWTLVSKETGKSAAFPPGTNVARAGKVNILTPILLAPGDQAIVTTGRSPVGVSFREHMCVGYLGERQTFSPPLPASCPTPSGEYSRFFDGDDEECLFHLRTIAQCASNSKVSGDVSNECEDFVDHYLNYNGCVAAHENDEGFAGHTWRVYLGKQDELWQRQRETILLLDASGKTIDALSY